MPRPPTCGCGTCDLCLHREYMRAYRLRFWKPKRVNPNVAPLLARLGKVARLVRAAEAERDRLQALAFEQGATDREIALATGESFDTVRMRRRRRGVRRVA